MNFGSSHEGDIRYFAGKNEKLSTRRICLYKLTPRKKRKKKTSFCQIPKTNLFDLMKLIGHIHAGHTKNMDINKFFKLTAFMKVKIDYDKS